MRVSRAQRKPAAAAMHGGFEWPVPHYCESVVPCEGSSHERAVLRMLDGSTLEGVLTRFLPSHDEIEFVPDGARWTMRVPIGEIEQLQLLRPLRMQPWRDAPGIEKHGNTAQPPHAQSICVAFVNGDALGSQTAGCDAQEAGLFLYLPAQAGEVTRIFIPVSAISRQQIGPLELLAAPAGVDEVRAAAT